MPTTEPYSTLRTADCRRRGRASWPASSARRLTSTTRPRSSSGSTTCRRSTSFATPRRPARTWRSWTWCGAHGVLVDAVSAGEIRPGPGRRLCGRGRSAADRLHGRHLRSRSRSTWCVEHGTARQLRLARHDRPVGPAWRRAARSRCGSIPASATATARRPTPAASNRSTASGTRNSTIACDAADHHGLARHRPAHAHRLGHRPGASGPGLRRDGTGGPRSRAARSRRSAPAADCRFRIASGETLRRSRRLLQAVGRHAQAAGRRVRPHAALEIEPGRYLVAESGYLVTRDPRHQADGRQHVLSGRRRLQ